MTAVLRTRARARRGARSQTSGGPRWTRPKTRRPRAVLQGVRPALSRTHPRDRVDRNDPDLAVPDLACLRGLDNQLEHIVHVWVVDEDVDAHLRDEVHDVLRTAVDLRVPALPAVPLHFA